MPDPTINVQVGMDTATVQAFTKALEGLTSALNTGVAPSTKKTTDGLKKKERAIRDVVTQYQRAADFANRYAGSTGESLRSNLASATSAMRKLHLQGLSPQHPEYQKLIKDIERYKAALNDLERPLAGTNKQQKLAGGSAIALAQGMSDIGQFGRSIPQGFTAINNNLINFVQLMSFSVREAGSLKLAMKGLWGAMMGPAGLLFAFSGIMGAIEIFANMSQGAKKEADELAEAFARLAVSIKGVGDFKALQLVPSDASLSIEQLKALLKLYDDINKEADVLRDIIHSLYTAMGQGTEVSEQLARRQAELKEITDGLAAAFGEGGEKAEAYRANLNALQEQTEELGRQKTQAEVEVELILSDASIESLLKSMETPLEDILEDFDKLEFEGSHHRLTGATQAVLAQQEAIKELAASYDTAIKVSSLFATTQKQEVQQKVSAAQSALRGLVEMGVNPMHPAYQRILHDLRQYQTALVATTSKTRENRREIEALLPVLTLQANSMALAAQKAADLTKQYKDQAEGIRLLNEELIRNIELRPSGGAPGEGGAPGDVSALVLMGNKEASLEAFNDLMSMSAEARHAIVSDFEMIGLAIGAIGEQTAINFGDAFKMMAEITTDSFGEMSAAGKAFFKLHKAFAIAEAIINTHQAATKALGAGPIIGPILMASTIAMGLAQVAKIASTSPGGGRGSGGGSGGGGTSSYLGPTSAVAPYNPNTYRKPLRGSLPVLLALLVLSYRQQRLRRAVAGV